MFLLLYVSNFSCIHLDSDMYNDWTIELKGMADRIISMRQQLFEALQAKGSFLSLFRVCTCIITSMSYSATCCSWHFFLAVQAHLVIGVTLSNRLGCSLLLDWTRSKLPSWPKSFTFTWHLTGEAKLISDFSSNKLITRYYIIRYVNQDRCL